MVFYPVLIHPISALLSATGQGQTNILLTPAALRGHVGLVRKLLVLWVAWVAFYEESVDLAMPPLALSFTTRSRVMMLM